MREKQFRNLINEQARRIILESEVGDVLDKELGNLMAQFSKELPKAQKPTEQNQAEQNKNQIQNESGALLAVSVGLAVPAIIKLISNFGKKAAEKVGLIMGGKSNLAKGSAEWFAELGETADHLHHLYLKPIEAVVKNVFQIKDEQNAHKIANVIFHAVVASMLYFSGVGAIKAMQSKEISLATLESALSAIKTGELTKFITSAV